jgi:hypothetical protein
MLLVDNIPSGFGPAVVLWCRILSGRASAVCPLRALTYSPFGMRARWRRYLAKLDVPVYPLHRDVFDRRYPKAATKAFPDGVAFPCILLVEGGQATSLRLIVSAEELASIPDRESLIDLVSERLVARGTQA